MEKINFLNEEEPDLSAETLNQLQENVENAINEALTTATTKIGDLSNLETTEKDSLVVAVNEILNDFNFTISKSGNWTIKKYDNGLIEMFHKVESTFDITQSYDGANTYGTMWCQTPSYDYPLTLTELYSSNTTVVASGHLTNFNYAVSSLSKYQGYLYDTMSLPNQTVKLYTTIVGRWK